jgi:hypothetical protein
VPPGTGGKVILIIIRFEEKKDYSATIASTGQASIQAPQSVQVSGSMI